MQLLRFQLEFDEVFRLLLDAAFLVLSVRMYRLVMARGQRHHRYWIVPWIIDDAISLIYRATTILSLRGFWHRTPAIRAFSYFTLDFAGCMNLVGTVMLYQILKAGKLPPIEDVADPEAWPPAPTGSRTP